MQIRSEIFWNISPSKNMIAHHWKKGFGHKPPIWHYIAPQNSSLSMLLWINAHFLIQYSTFIIQIQGSKGGAVVRALTSHQCVPGSTPGVDATCGLRLLLVLSLALRGFSPGNLVFPSPQKPTFPNSNSTRNQVDEEPLCGCATSKSLFILFILFIAHSISTFIF